MVTASMPQDTQALADAVRAGDRTALGRAITLVESRKPEHEERAQALLLALLPDGGKANRVGITGIPGVGKSTTIDALGQMLTAKGHKVAVLAVDPTSQRSGGSILGDKTRMAGLATDPNAFIRPSPTAGTLGGVTRRSRESMLVCEAAGYDVIIVETVGIGQSETAVADMVDFFLVLMQPGAGDELQGIKKGVLEIADMIAINKADGDNIKRANQTAAEYKAAFHIIAPSSANWTPPVITVSGRDRTGLDQLWAHILEHRTALTDAGEFETKRSHQMVRWMWSMLEDRIMSELKQNEKVRDLIPDLEHQVSSGIITPVLAVRKIADIIGI